MTSILKTSHNLVYHSNNTTTITHTIVTTHTTILYNLYRYMVSKYPVKLKEIII